MCPEQKKADLFDALEIVLAKDQSLCPFCKVEVLALLMSNQMNDIVEQHGLNHAAITIGNVTQNLTCQALNAATGKRSDAYTGNPQVRLDG